jgi:hypothetical protein
MLALAALLAAAQPAEAGVLDAAADGDDVVFTWDTGPDDLLRGTSPDALVPWMSGVASPLRVPGENALGRGDSYYRLASGSNMAWRIELSVEAGTPEEPVVIPVSLPERRAAVTAFQVLEEHPEVVEVIWWDGLDQRHEHVARAPAGFLIGDDEALPHHGGAWLALPAPATVRLVGSDEPADAGWLERDVEPGLPDGVAVLGLTPGSRWLRGFELLCGEEGADWFDDDGDGRPDDCGRDLDGDGSRDTGLWGDGEPFQVLGLLRVDARTGLIDAFAAVQVTPFDPDRAIATGLDFTLRRGEGVAVDVDAWSGASGLQPNVPFRPPTW